MGSPADDDALAATVVPDGELDPHGATLGGPAGPPDALPAGATIGRYRITGVLGHGGMGVVYAAHDPDLARRVAIKLLRPELRASRARLLREGQAIARLTHPNVVTVHDVGTHDHDLFIAMELVAGRTLGAWLRERRRPWPEVLAIITAAGRGLAAAHAAGLVHRDFKPENVLLGVDEQSESGGVWAPGALPVGRGRSPLGNIGRVVVTDFGLAAISLWTIELDDASQLRRAPVVRYTPPSGTMLRVFDAAAGRVLVEVLQSRQRLLRYHGGRGTELPSKLGNLRLAGIDLQAGVGLAYSTDQLVRFALDGKERTVVPAHTILPALRDGRPHQLVPRGANTWELVELGDDDSTRVVQTVIWKDGDGAPSLRCATADTSRCLVSARAAETLRIAPLTAAGLGEITTIDGVSWNPDLADDGRRALVPALDGRVLIVDLQTHAVHALGRVDAGCTPRTVRWHGDAAWAVELCPDRFAIGEVSAGAPFREVVTADGWISGLETLPDGDFLYSEMDWDPQVQIIDGL